MTSENRVLNLAGSNVQRVCCHPAPSMQELPDERQVMKNTAHFPPAADLLSPPRTTGVRDGIEVRCRRERSNCTYTPRPRRNTKIITITTMIITITTTTTNTNTTTTSVEIAMVMGENHHQNHRSQSQHQPEHQQRQAEAQRWHGHRFQCKKGSDGSILGLQGVAVREAQCSTN